MYPASFRYLRCRTTEEALSVLAAQGDRARVLAGGASLVPLLKYRQVRVDTVLDIMQIPGVAGWRVTEGAVAIRAGTRHAEIEHDGALSGLVPMLSEVAAGIGDAQVRNMGTIGGGVAAAEPTGDWGPALLALDARVRLQSTEGTQMLRCADLFDNQAGRTRLDPRALIDEVHVPLPEPRSGAAHEKFRLRAVTSLGCVAVTLRVSETGETQQCRVGVGGFTPAPVAAPVAAASVCGTALDDDVVAAAVAALRSELPFHADDRTSAQHRATVAGATFATALRRAHTRAMRQP